MDPMVKAAAAASDAVISSFQEDRQDPYFDTIRHQDISPTSITNNLIKLCDPKFSCSDELLAKFSNFVVEKLIYESPLSEILHTLDSPEFSKKLFSLPFDYNRFLTFCRYLCSSEKQGYEILGTTFFSRVWKHNAHFQYEIIKYCIFSDWFKQILSSCPANSNLTKKVPQIEMLKCPLDYEADPQISCWKYQCLSQILLDLSENQMISSYLEEIFFRPLNKCPDLLVFALLECHGNYRLKESLLVKALLNFIYVSPNHPNSNPNAALIIQKIWPSDFVYTAKTSLSLAQKSLLTSMVELYTSSTPEEQSYKLSKILDLSQDLKVLNVLLSSNTYSFVIDLACFASRREYLKLDKWLNDKIQQIGIPFVEACVHFLTRRCTILGASESVSTLPNETYRTILNCLRHYVSDNPKTMLELEILRIYNKFQNWQNQFVNNQIPGQNQVMMPVKPNQFESIGSQPSFAENTVRSPQLNSQIPLFLEPDQEFNKDIEEEADSYFQRIYNQEQSDRLTIDEFLDMLKCFQESSVKREKEIAACMIRNLFKEFPFLSQYPDKELIITGEIFGGIVQNNLLKGVHIISSLRCVLDAMKRPLNTRYITFAQAALNKLKTRLKEFPQFCQHLSSLQSYRELSPNLMEYIEYGKQSMEPPSANQMKRISLMKMMPTNSSASSSDNHFQSMIDVTPPMAFQDKISFIINNLSQMNLPKKAEEFKDLFLKEKDQYLPWFSNYFVMKRVGVESNFHDLYSSFMVKVNIVDLSEKVLGETYRNIKILLRSNMETDNFNDRTMLKNLGQWLGLITLAQNKPILTRDLDLRYLLIEAYQKGFNQILYVVPFVTKVLSASAKSKVFRPPCPWTVKLIKILVELHSQPDLKLNLKFEVEVLCNTLEIDLNQYVDKSDELRNKKLHPKFQSQLGDINPIKLPLNFASNDQVMEPNNIPVVLHPSPSFDVNSLHGPVPNAASNPIQSAPDMILPNSMIPSIVIQPNLQIVIMNPTFKTMIRQLIEKTVHDWISFIAEKVIRVCSVTTEALVKKDFAMEPNAELMRSAAHKMMRCLISGYSLINTEELLSSRLQHNLFSYFQQQAKQLQSMNISKELIDSTISTLINDNIESCVNFVQKTCIERGIDELDKKMKPDFEARQNAKVDGKKNSSVSLKQMQIYEEMGRNIAGFNANSTSFYSQNESSKIINPAPPNLANQNVYVFPEPPAPMVDAFSLIYDKLIKHLSELIQEFEYCHCATEAMHQVLEILKVCKQNPRDQPGAVTLIKNVVNGLRELVIHNDAVTDYAVISRTRDFYLLLLKALTDQRAYNLRFTTTNITRNIIEHWISMAQTFPDDVFDMLLRAELINFNYMDQEFYQFLENGSNTIAITMILNFLKYYLNNINANHFASTLELLQRIAMKVNQGNPLVNDLKSILNMARLNAPSEVENSSPVEKFDLIIKEWITLYNCNKSLNSSFATIVKNMNSHGLLKNDELISCFFKYFLETCVERCYKIIYVTNMQSLSLSTSDIHIRCFEFVDAFSVLVLLFIKQSGNQGNVDQKFQFLNRIMSILAQTAYRDQEIHHKDFLSLTYYRILLYIFIEFFYAPFNLGIQDVLFSHDNLFEVFKWHLVRNYCNVLHLLSPLKIPSFTFSWLDFISHRVFIGKCLDNTPQINYKTWHVYYTLLNDLLVFQKPLLQNIDSYVLNANMKTSMELYKGTLKLILLLYHDFSEFLSEYCYNLCDIIPIRAVQLRNIILSANPINLPDVTHMKVDNLYEIIPPVRVPNSSMLDQLTFQKELESFILQRGPPSFLNELSNFIYNSEKQPGLNTSLINALTLYLGLSATQTNKTVTINSVNNSIHKEIFHTLLHTFDSQGRYILINSMIDHLRYPNTETLFFICLLLALFRDNEEHIREQIIRVLLERIIANRPHPWGVVYVINELIRNPSYKLLEHNFIKCYPEIEKYFSQQAT